MVPIRFYVGCASAVLLWVLIQTLPSFFIAIAFLATTYAVLVLLFDFHAMRAIRNLYALWLARRFNKNKLTRKQRLVCEEFIEHGVLVQEEYTHGCDSAGHGSCLVLSQDARWEVFSPW